MQALLRISPDITLKAARTRSRFARQVEKNLRLALRAAGLDARIERAHARMLLTYEDRAVEAAASRVFGIHSLSPCTEAPLGSLEDLIARTEALVADRIRGRTFAVRARVRDEAFGHASQEVNERVGAALAKHARVNLDHPEVTVAIELRDGRVHFYTEVIPGQSGLPIGAGGRAVLLLSAGFDSAVAAYLMLRRGVDLDLVCCRLGGAPHADAVLRVANHLRRVWSPGIRGRLWIVPLEEVVERMRRDVTGAYQQLVLKRIMYRVADVVARDRRADAIVTGEALGQVSSQTLRNLRALEGDESVPVLRPLLTYPKNDILELARRIGTFDLSSGVPEYCALNAGKPATGAHPAAVRAQEAKLELDERALLSAAECLLLPNDVRAPSDLMVASVPEAACVLDLRTPPARSRAPLAGAVAVDPVATLEDPSALDRAATYVVVCDAGARAAWFAGKLRDLGFRAHALGSPDAARGARGG